MANLPTIPENYTPLQVWEILTDPKKAAAVLKTILDATEVHNQRLKRFETFKTVEAYKSEVTREAVAALEEKAEIQKYVKAQKGRADSALSKAELAQAQAETFQRETHANAQAREANLNLREQELTKREEATARDLAEGLKQKELGERLLKEANQIKAEYETKLAKMREMAA